MDGPHLALDGEGILYATQPELGGFLRIAADDEEKTEVWALPAGEPVRKLVGIGAGPNGELVLTDSENGNIYLVPPAP